LRIPVFVIAAAALIGAAAAALAQTVEPNKGCDSGVTVEMVDCLNAKAEFWDKRLNAAYPKALNGAQPKQREQLRKAQRAWVAFRDANCLYWSLGEGTIARVQAVDCFYRMTKERAEEIEGAAEDN
jgi:uncharacterized protein YecT (DUF1311 family)